MVLWRPTRPYRINIQKRYPFPYRGLECKSRKSRNTWSNWQIWPWSTERSRAKANRVLQRECTGHSRHPLPKSQKKTLHMDITRWSTPKSDWLDSLQPKMEKLYTVSKNKTRVDCGSDNELLNMIQYPLDHWKRKRVPEKHLLLLYWLCQSLWLCGSQEIQT